MGTQEHDGSTRPRQVFRVQRQVRAASHESQSLLTAAAPAQAVEEGDSRAEAAVTAVRLEVLTNHGDPDYTCVYGVGVHGTPIPL